MDYGHQKLADSLPELPQGSMTDKTNERSATASGSSQPQPPRNKSAKRAEIRMEESEDTSTLILPDESMTDDNFTMSGAATPVQDEPDTGSSQVEGADIESELNYLLAFDDQSPSPSMVAHHTVNP